LIVKEYDVILADPPWRYDFSKSKIGSIEAHYPTMALEDICRLCVPAAPNSVLYLWATNPKLVEALTVMDAWGFKYRTNLVWDKEWAGLGYWFRGQHELLLVGVKGKFSPPNKYKRIPSVWRERKGKHSVKPKGIRKLIGEWFPDARKLELFARDKAPGWDVWGSDVESDVNLEFR